MDMRLPLRWIALLHGRIHANLAATSGIHHGIDAIKLLVAGADVTMLCSVLLKRGIKQLSEIEREMREWLEQHEYESVRQMQGSMSQMHVADEASYERAHYTKILQSWRPDPAGTLL